MIAGAGSQLISDIRDRIITGCQSQAPGAWEHPAICRLHSLETWKHHNRDLQDNLFKLLAICCVGSFLHF